MILNAGTKWDQHWKQLWIPHVSISVSQYICIDDLKHIAGVRKSSKLSDGNCNNWSRKKYMYVPVNYECFLL